MAVEFPSMVNAYGSVTGATGATFAGSGTFTSSRTGKGDYNLTLDDGVDGAESVLVVSSRGAVGNICTAVHTSDSVKQVLVVDNAGAAIDGDFSFVLYNSPSR